MSGDDAWAIPSVEELLAHGGWALLDPRPMATRNPDTFELPTPAALAALDRGSAVRAAAATLTIADEVSEGGPPYDDRGHPRLCATVERMWFVVLDRRDDDLLCHLDSLPLATHTRLTRGARLTLPRRI